MVPRKISIFIFLLLFVSMACNNDDQLSEPIDPSPPLGEILLLKEVKKNGFLESEYEYFDDDKISKIKSYYNNSLAQVADYSYALDTTIIIYSQPNDTLTSKRIYFLLENTTTIQLDKYFNGIHGETRHYKNFDLSCPQDSIIYFNYQGDRTYEVCLNYLDENCSYEIDYGCNGVAHSHIKDNSKAYNQSAITETFSLISDKRELKNTIKYTRQSSGGINESKSYDSVFEFNEKDFPISETRTFLNGVVEVFEYTYYD